MSDLRKVASLWRKTGKNGNTFYSGELDAKEMKSALAGGETRLLLFAANQKLGRGPDIELFTAPDARKPAAPVEPKPATAGMNSDFDEDSISS